MKKNCIFILCVLSLILMSCHNKNEEYMDDFVPFVSSVKVSKCSSSCPYRIVSIECYDESGDLISSSSDFGTYSIPFWGKMEIVYKNMNYDGIHFPNEIFGDQHLTVDVGCVYLISVSFCDNGVTIIK